MSLYNKRSRFAKGKKNGASEAQQLSITSLLDVLTIILVFLMKNVSMESAKVSQVADMKYPTTITVDKLTESAQVVPIKLYTNPMQVLIGVGNVLVGTPDDIVNDKAKRQAVLDFLELELTKLPEDKQADACLVVQADRDMPCGYITTVVGFGTTQGYENIYFASLEEADWLKAYSLSSGQ